MNTMLSKPIRLTCVLIALMLGAPLHAGVVQLTAAKSASGSNYVTNAPSKSSREAAAAAREKVGGRVISVKPAKGGQGYRVRMLVEGGRVVTVNVDAKGKVRNR